MNGIIFDIKEMAVHDGPGIRTTVFFKGCPLRCIWCHNPEGLNYEKQLSYNENKCLNCNLCKKPCSHPDCKEFGRCVHICPENCIEIVGREICSESLAEELKASAAVLGESFGGFTFSGGEPLAQPQFLLALLDELKEFHLCIETSGFADCELFEKTVDILDFVIMDIKLADSTEHKKYTGVSNENILKNLAILKNSRKPHIIRTPLIRGITDTEENLSAIKKLIGDSEWEKLPQNELAGAKYKRLGMKYEL